MPMSRSMFRSKPSPMAVAVALVALGALPGVARADVVEQPADGFTLRCHGMDLQAVGGAQGGTFVFASSFADSADGTLRYLETVTAATVKLTDPATGAAYTIGGVDGSQGSTLDTVIAGEQQISGNYHAHWIVRSADGAVVGETDILIDYTSGATSVTGSCGS